MSSRNGKQVIDIERKQSNVKIKNKTKKKSKVKKKEKIK